MYYRPRLERGAIYFGVGRSPHRAAAAVSAAVPTPASAAAV